MGVLLIGDTEKAAIAGALARARRDVVPWSVLQHFAKGSHPRPVLTLENRGPLKPPAKEHLMLGTYEVAISFEEQPAGIVKHLSIGIPGSSKLPDHMVVAMICAEFGFSSFPPEDGGVWVEEYERDRHAVNIIEVTEPAKPTNIQ